MPDLDALFWPRSIALIGASPDKHGIRGRIVDAVRQHGFDGPIYPVSRSHDSIHGLRTYPSASALPEGVDLAIVWDENHRIAGHYQPEAMPTTLVIDHRGEVVPVIDLRARFGLDATQESSRSKWILVDMDGRTVGLMGHPDTAVETGSHRPPPAHRPGYRRAPTSAR